MSDISIMKWIRLVSQHFCIILNVFLRANILYHSLTSPFYLLLLNQSTHSWTSTFQYVCESWGNELVYILPILFAYLIICLPSTLLLASNWANWQQYKKKSNTFFVHFSKMFWYIKKENKFLSQFLWKWRSSKYFKISHQCLRTT